MSIFSAEETLDFQSSVERALSKAPSDPARLWELFAELGWLSLPLLQTSDLGGLGGGATEMAIVQRAIGNSLVVSPYLATAGMGLPVIQELVSDSDRAPLIEDILAGRLILAVDCGAEDSALVRGEGPHAGVSGIVAVLAPYVRASHALVRVDVNGAAGVAVIALDQEGVELRPYPLLDGTPAARVTFREAKTRALWEGPEVLRRWSFVRARAAVLACAEAVGAMDGTFQATLDYVKVRRQFGTTIGSFQVIQHRLVDMDVGRRRAAALISAAAQALDEGHPDALRFVSACKAGVGRSARLVGEQAIQLHGGMGLTSEGAAARFHLRILRLGDMFGGADHHIEALGTFEQEEILELAI